MNIAARVQNLAGGDEICITEDVHDAEGVAEIIAPYPVAKSEAELRGVNKAMCSGPGSGAGVWGSPATTKSISAKLSVTYTE